MIAAIGAQNRALGKNNDLIWKIPGDLPRFKALTSGHVIIMGRKTYESIGRPLPNRTNIIVTRNTDFKIEGCLVVHSLAEALAEANLIEEEEIFVIGGGDIYKEALPFTDRLYLTLVHDEKDADVYFPEYSAFQKSIFLVEHREDTPPHTYTILEK